jgi:hypothetical protein
MLCNSGQVKLWTFIEVCQENLRLLKNEAKIGTLGTSREYGSKYPIKSDFFLEGENFYIKYILPKIMKFTRCLVKNAEEPDRP